MIYALSQEEYYTILQPIENQLTHRSIVDNLYYEVYTTDALPDRKLVYPCVYELAEDCLAALEATFQHNGTGDFYLDIGGWEYRNKLGVMEKLPQYYYVPSGQLRYVLDDEGVALEYDHSEYPYVIIDHWILYSAQGDWALHIHGEANYALLGGTQEFMKLFDSFYPDDSEQIQNFLKKYAGNCTWDAQNLEISYNWITRLMVHVYGYEIGIRMMNDLGLFNADNPPI